MSVYIELNIFLNLHIFFELDQNETLFLHPSRHRTLVEERCDEAYPSNDILS